MKKKLFRIKAELDFLPASQGGRSEKFISGYRPHFRFIPNMAKSGAIISKDQTLLTPNKGMLLDVYFVNDQFFGDDFGVGTEFTFGEAEFDLGTGKVVEVYGFGEWDI